MASVLHGSARTPPRLRAGLQASKESSRALAARYGLNAKTVRKWRKRITTVDAPMGPKKPKSTVLTPAEEAIVVAFRQKTLLPLDDVLGCLRDAIPHLNRSALHRCLQRHGISRLPIEETQEQRKRFKTYEIGYVHIDSCEPRHADGKLVMFLAIDRVSKFTYVEFHDSVGKMEGSAFLSNAVEVFPYKIHTVLTDNGMAFADLPKNRSGPSRCFLGPHIFDRVCINNGIEHRLTKPYHPWTNGQAERMNRTIKDGQGLPLRRSEQPEGPCPSLRHSLQLRQALEGPEMANTLSGPLRGLDESSRNLQNQSTPPHPGTTHVAQIQIFRGVIKSGP
jgi:transposase-like protein